LVLTINMTTVEDESLYEYASRLKDAVVLITGGANGIGRTAAIDFAKHGAKVVIGDLDESNGQSAVDEITSAGGQATFLKTNVLEYDSLAALFQHAIQNYKKLDVVVPCAGITENSGSTVGVIRLDESGVPKPPSLKPVQINLLSVMNTTHLALHYLTLDGTKPPRGLPLEDLDPSTAPPADPNAPLKSIVLIGSVASIQGIPRAPNYSAAKHGVVGFMGAIHLVCRTKGIHIGTICPWFADTAIVPTSVKIALAGIPKVPVPRIAGAIIRCATEPDWLKSSALWTIPDGNTVFRIDREILNEGVYKLLNDRLLALARPANKMVYAAATVADLWSVLGTKVLMMALGITMGILVRRYIST